MVKVSSMVMERLCNGCYLHTWRCTIGGR